MADLEQWRPAVPEDQRLLAAAPMRGEWVVPHVFEVLLVAHLVVSTLLFGVEVLVVELPLEVRLAALLALYGGAAAYAVWWRRQHPGPVGMAAIMDAGRGLGPVLLVTDRAVLATDLVASRPRLRLRAAAAGAAGTLPGLVAVEAVGERLCLRFADGSTALLRQRSPKRGSAARVAELAAPVLRRQARSEAALTLPSAAVS